MLSPTSVANLMRRAGRTAAVVSAPTAFGVASVQADGPSSVLCGRRPFTSGRPPHRSGTAGSGNSNDGGRGAPDFASLAKEALRTAAAASTEGASAFFKPQATSPLHALRPPSPPTASDALPFGQLNRGNRIHKYVNANVAPTARAPPGCDADVSSQTASTRDASAGVAAEGAVTSAPPMNLDKLMRTHRRPPMASNNTSSHDGSNARASPPMEATSTSSASTTVERAQAAIAAAERQKHTTAQSSSSGSSSGDSASTKQHHGHGPGGGASGAASSEGKATSAATPSTTHVGHHQQLYREHCTIGWAPSEFYDVVADVARYPTFLPWCLEAQVHSTRPVRLPASVVKQKSPHYFTTVVQPMLEARQRADAEVTEEHFMVDAEEMTATLWVGFSFFKEHYTSRVTLLPGAHITASLADESTSTTAADGVSATSSQDEGLLASLFRKAADSTGVSAVKKSILKSLICEWDFIPIEGRHHAVEVCFSVSFEFKNPMHAKMIMNNIVSLMTRSFERQCERLYGPPSAQKQPLPLPTL